MMLNAAQSKAFSTLRREVIALQFKHLNPEQQRAVLTTEGPLLLLAGAGSGKTTVLINRVANLIRYGRGSDSDEVADSVTEEDLAFLAGYLRSPSPADKERADKLCAVEPPMPWNIIAITFTNKAAGELKERLEKMLGAAAGDMWVSTFHSACVRILRRDITKLGFSESFTIYDSDDSIRVVKDALKELSLDEKAFVPRTVLGYISRAKDDMLLSADYERQSARSGDYRLIKMAQIYSLYEKKLWEANALDFDDIILHTVRLLQQDEETRTYYQRKFRYVLIDEYQDTNHLQYLLASLLAGGHENICVVGDDDQSIYRFRGATIENILSFEKQYKGARVIRLEQNYRSTKNILEASNAVIRNNQGRKGKELWTEHPQGDKLQLYTAGNEHEEADFVLGQIMTGLQSGRQEKDFAILYRNNACSNVVYQTLVRNGLNVYIKHPMTASAEIRDVMAYLYVIQNGDDNLRLQRIINVPPRGIGAKTVEGVQEIAAARGVSLYEVISHPEQYPEAEKSCVKMKTFTDLISSMREQVNQLGLLEFYELLLTQSGYLQALESKNTPENAKRREHLMAFKSIIQDYVGRASESDTEPSLTGFLEEMALDEQLGDQGSEESGEKKPKEERIQMMTMHGAKGLEFPVVFLVGMEDGLFPSQQSIGEPEGMEEERRLCYVAMTRAKEQLTITYARQRMLYGRTTFSQPSRFLAELPPDCVAARAPRQPAPARQQAAPVVHGAFSGAAEHRRYPPVPRTEPRPAVSFAVGAMVEHRAFGRGMILTATKMGNDTLLEIAFDNHGTKKLLANSASAHMTVL